MSVYTEEAFKKQFEDLKSTTTSASENSLASLLSTGKYSDLVIRCKDTVLRVHRSIVCPRSNPLAAMLEHQFLEAITGEINLEDDDPAAVARMIQFLYTSEYDDSCTPILQSPPPAPETRRPSSAKRRKIPPSSRVASVDSNSELSEVLINHVRVYIVADKYDIPELKALACLKYKREIPHYASVGVKSRDFDYMSDFQPGGEDDPRMVTQFIKSIKLIYENTIETDRALKTVAIKVAHFYKSKLAEHSDMKALLNENSNIGLDLFQHSAANPLHQHVEYETAGGLEYWLAKCVTCKDYINCPSCQLDCGFTRVISPSHSHDIDYDLDHEGVFQCRFPACGELIDNRPKLLDDDKNVIDNPLLNDKYDCCPIAFGEGKTKLICFEELED